MANRDEVKGRVKETVGDLTNDDNMKTDGKKDRLVGKAKDAIDEASKKVSEAIRRR